MSIRIVLRFAAACAAAVLLFLGSGAKAEERSPQTSAGASTAPAAEPEHVYLEAGDALGLMIFGGEGRPPASADPLGTTSGVTLSPDIMAAERQGRLDGEDPLAP
jgi:hypothetical protein